MQAKSASNSMELYNVVSGILQGTFSENSIENYVDNSIENFRATSIENFVHPNPNDPC